MKKAYLSPQLVSFTLGNEDAILASTINGTTIGIGGGDWGVQDEF